MLQAALDQADLPCSEIDSSQWGSDRQALQNVGAKGVNSNKLAIFVVKPTRTAKAGLIVPKKLVGHQLQSPQHA